MRAKFKCDEVTLTTYGKRIKMTPVTSGSEENKKFFLMTPYGEITIGTINPDIIINPGEIYYVDFTKEGV